MASSASSVVENIREQTSKFVEKASPCPTQTSNITQDLPEDIIGGSSFAQSPYMNMKISEKDYASSKNNPFVQDVAAASLRMGASAGSKTSSSSNVGFGSTFVDGGDTSDVPGYDIHADREKIISMQIQEMRRQEMHRQEMQRKEVEKSPETHASQEREKRWRDLHIPSPPEGHKLTDMKPLAKTGTREVSHHHQ